MRIERVDEKTVKCFLSNEEMEEYEIDYKDFIMRSDKAREVVQDIIEQAEEEVGYKPPKFAFDLQIMLLPDQGLILTFSDRDAETRDTDQFIECLKEMKRILQRTREKIGGNNAATDEGKENRQAAGEEAGDGQEQVSQPSFAVFAFSGIGRIMEFAAMLPSNLMVDSSLYEMDGLYYLYLLKGRASYERYSRACVQALEFAGLYAAEESQVAQLEGSKKELTLRHLLTHTSGLEWREWTGPTNWMEFQTAENWVDYILGRQQVAQPGAVFNYSTVNTHLSDITAACPQHIDIRIACKHNLDLIVIIIVSDNGQVDLYFRMQFHVLFHLLIGNLLIIGMLIEIEYNLLSVRVFRRGLRALTGIRRIGSLSGIHLLRICIAGRRLGISTPAGCQAQNHRRTQKQRHYFTFLHDVFLPYPLLYTMKVFDFHSMDGHAARQAAG